MRLITYVIYLNCQLYKLDHYNFNNNVTINYGASIDHQHPILKSLFYHNLVIIH